MKSQFRILFFGLSLLSLTQCLESEEERYVSRFNFDDKRQAEEVLSSLSVTCEDPNQCPEASGGLFFIETSTSYYSTQYSGGVCSQTLIAPDKILTNRHCLPANALSKNASCSNITIFFPPSLGRPAEKIKCKSVIDLSADYAMESAMHPDWAILELASHSNRTPVNIDTSGIPNDSSITVYPVYYERSYFQTSGNRTTFSVLGKMRRVSCQSKMNSIFSTYYQHPNNPLFSLDCDHEVIPGNSGSGIFDRNQRLLGAVSMAYKNNGEPSKVLGQSTQIANKFAGGTNAHCIHSFNQQPSEACLFDAKNEVRASLGMILPIIFAQKSSETEQQKYNSALLSESSIEWGNHNSQFADTILQTASFSMYAENLTTTVATFIASQDAYARLPKTPVCISKTRKTAGVFKFFLPSLYAKFTSVRLLPSGLFEAPLSFSRLIFSTRYDSSANTFKARLLRLSSAKLIEYLALKTHISNEFEKCFFSGSSSDCRELAQYEDQQKTFFDIAGEEGAIYFNEDFIYENTAGTNEVSIPVCED